MSTVVKAGGQIDCLQEEKKSNLLQVPVDNHVRNEEEVQEEKDTKKCDETFL